MTAGGQVMSGIQQSQMANYQAAIAQQNKQIAREGSIDAIKLGQDKQRQLGREVAGRVGAQEARMAGNNVDTTSGSAARVISDTQMIGREDMNALSENINREVRGHQIDAWNYESESRAKKADASNAIVGTAFGVASTALGGATQYAKFGAANNGSALKLSQKRY